MEIGWFRKLLHQMFKRLELGRIPFRGEIRRIRVRRLRRSISRRRPTQPETQYIHKTGPRDSLVEAKRREQIHRLCVRIMDHKTDST